MNRTKIGNLSEGQTKNTENNWRNKSLTKTKENQRLKSRLKEVTTSRDLWKTKYFTLKESSPKGLKFSEEKAKSHQYQLWVICMLLDFQKYGTLSFRACRHCLGCLMLSLKLSGRLPSHCSIRNWACKMGCYRLQTSENKRGDYVLFVDESMVFGSDKVLLILGIEQTKIPQQQALSHHNMEVLYMDFSKEWKFDSIENILTKIAKNKTIKYIVSDEGTNLVKAYKGTKQAHIEDCTHIFANYLKKMYGKDETFEMFRKLIGTLRKNWALSKVNSSYLPPGMRGKMRFANIFSCVNWAKRHLDKWASLPENVQESLAFLKQEKVFIEDLFQIGEIFKMVCEKLKNEGFSEVGKREIDEALSKLKASKNAAIFIQKVTNYLEHLSLKMKEIGQEKLLCSSDIIESYFGKFKYRINPNTRGGLTEFLFTMSNFSGNFTEEEVKSALEKNRIKDLKDVLNRNTPEGKT